MKSILRRLIKFFAYSAAAVVILLAIAVGLFRLFLPRVPEYQDEIKQWASAAIGVEVEFSGMDARWGLSGPELKFYEAELIRLENGVRIVKAEEVRIGVGFLRLLFEQALVVDSIAIRDTSIEVRQNEDGTFRVQGMPLDELFSSAGTSAATPSNIELIGDDVEVRFIQPGDERPRFFSVPGIRVSVDENRIAIDADVELPEDMGRRLSLSATQIVTASSESRPWDIIVDADDMQLAGWSELRTSKRQLSSGIGDLNLAISLLDGGLANATADFDFVDVGVLDSEFFDLTGRVEIDVSGQDWLVAAEDIVVSWQDHVWPESSLRIEASVDADDQIAMLDARASYLRLDDLRVFQELLSDDLQSAVTNFEFSGEVRNLVTTVSDMGSDAPRFNVSAELDRVGVVNTEQQFSLLGFTGQVRADRSGGRLEIDSSGLEIFAAEYLAEVVTVDEAIGTVIWRSSGEQITILSDSVAISNELFASQSSVQLVLNKDGSSPQIDLESNWSIADLTVAKRHIPKKLLHPVLYDWFQMALVKGSVSQGTTTLNGPLEKFPFDDGEGRLLVEASVRNLTFKYHKDWPATSQSDIDVILDNVRLYTTANRSNSAGISVVNADVDIPDLREPVLHLKSFSTAPLQAIRAFSMQSPIAKVFGGQLDRVAVSGEATFNLDLTVPLKQKQIKDFEFVARIRSNNGTLAVDGFSPPITDLIGEVTIERGQISSEGLGGRFLGDPVVISLANSDDEQYSLVATALGTVTDVGIVEDLGAPLAGLINGRTAYEARVLFPRVNGDTRAPLTIQIDSDLTGMAFALPEPLRKDADEVFSVSGDIRFMRGGETIRSSGFAVDNLAWDLAFNRPQGHLDFDRGVVTLGEDMTEVAETRGLHIRGSADVVRLEDWLALSRSGEDKVSAADRIRSIDLAVEHLYLVGQHIEGHRVRVDRSALDWLVQFDGADISGSAFVPYNFGGDRAMVLEMKRLRLPGDDTASDVDNSIDPRRLPPIQLTATEFAFGDRYLGAVKANLIKTELGLVAENISSIDKTFKIVGTGSWVADGSDPLGSHSSVSAKLTSSNVEETMTRLNYQTGIASKKMSMQFDIDWSGSPRANFFDVLDGNVSVRLGEGKLVEVEPGAGRMFGLMSIVALPRRLSFDFRDVFGKGFSFDKITGTFKIDNGITTTCDLSLEGPAADIGIVGEANLATRTYDQTAVVSANVGNSLPIVGAVVAGPQVAAALLIFSQIFKKPLQEVGQVYYGIDGSWDAPNVESSNTAAFVESGRNADCLTAGK